MRIRRRTLVLQSFESMPRPSEHILHVNRTRLIALAAIFALIAAVTDASAQWSPTRPVRLIVPFPPGGAVDVIGRIVASRLPDATLESVACGHLFMLTRPGETARRVERFIVDNAAPQRAPLTRRFT